MSKLDFTSIGSTLYLLFFESWWAHALRLSDLTGQNKNKRAGLSDVKTIGAYWTLLAGVVPQDRLAKFVSHLDDPHEFKTPHRVPALR